VGLVLAMIRVSPLRVMLARKRIAMWRHHLADAWCMFIFGEPVPRTAAGGPWRLASWHDGDHWIAYVWRGDEWHGAGFHVDRDTACRRALGEARRNVRKRRVGRKSGANT